MPDPHTVRLTRRTALKAGGAAAAAAALSGGVPAWARPAGARASAVRQPGSRPFPGRPEGTGSMPQIEHIVVLMMENHTFDNLLGMLPHQVASRRHVDGFTVSRHGLPVNANPDASGRMIRARRGESPCQRNGVGQNWRSSHIAYARGRNDGFVLGSSAQAMQYWDKRHLPFSYSLAAHFPIGQRYFSSVLAQTYPNRRFLFTGTASGTVATDGRTFTVKAPNGTIFDRFDDHGISWRNYHSGLPSPAIVPGYLAVPGRPTKNLRPIADFFTDARRGKLPSFALLDPQYDWQSQENPQDLQYGEQFMADVVHAVTHSPNWRKTALFITYDEGGGYYDHVPPPRAITPDDTPPILKPTDPPGAYDRYGFRVPLYVVSPWARRGYVSSVVQDHTSILRFVERKWNLGAMTRRDANAHDMTDYFDFRRMSFREPPRLAAGPSIAAGLEQCAAEGLTPPQPSAAAR